MDTPLSEALASASAKLVEKAFGYTRVGQLLGHYPRRYATRGELTPMDQAAIGEEVTLVAEIVERPQVRVNQSRGGARVETIISDGASAIRLTFFAANPSHGQNIAAKLRPGVRGLFSGKVSVYNNRKQLTQPDFELFDREAEAEGSAADSVSNAQAWANGLIPLYPATHKLPSWRIQKLIEILLEKLGVIEDPVPADIVDDEGLLDAREALQLIHLPTSERDVEAAQRTLRLHEALIMQVTLLEQREYIRAMDVVPRPAGDLLERFDAALPFSLTEDQQKVGATIGAELVGEWPMSRLVQGEVGSGKTLVALRAMLQVAQTGGQAALIAPTEVLAGQHLRSITKMLGPDLAAELMPTLLTGQMPAADRRRAALRVASGQSLIVVGTHALISDSVQFAELGLVVVDEQHRFGVDQREALRTKGQSPHVLVLTATPIPRTVAMTVFGDLDVSTIRTMPAGRAGIESFVAPGDNQAWFTRVWDRAEEEIDKGFQVFVVCAAIDAEQATAEEDAEAPTAPAAPEEEERKGPRWGVVQTAELVATHPGLSKRRVATLHGRMPAAEKDEVMRAFAAGEIDMLIATTVIEVGVDVPNASAMIVLDADRFGVSQLHQLRGRVGRGGVPGLCLLVTEAHPASLAFQRVQAVASTLDGFRLAEIDLVLRGEGDVLGGAQSGARSQLRLLRVIQDAPLIAKARRIAERILADDPGLSSNPELAAVMDRTLTREQRLALRKS